MISIGRLSVNPDPPGRLYAAGSLKGRYPFGGELAEEPGRVGKAENR